MHRGWFEQIQACSHLLPNVRVDNRVLLTFVDFILVAKLADVGHVGEQAE